MLLRNEHYDKQDLTELNDLSNWVHVRPNILNQGRVVWFNELKAKREREKELARLAKLRKMEEMEFEEEEEEEDLGCFKSIW